ETGSGWRLVAVEPSYDHFLGRAARRPVASPPSGSVPNAGALLAACAGLHGSPPDLVAIDMPLSLEPITGRRVSDDAVSRHYARARAGTHSPSRDRPGALSDALRLAFAHAGYGLQLATPLTCPGLLEVYPHPALIALLGRNERLPYKAGKIGRYWPLASVGERRHRLVETWREVAHALEGRIAGVAAVLPVPAPNASGAALKTYEDQLDAVVCAWVGITALEGKATPFGDTVSAIWCPSHLRHT
ncbi:MAG TPA: DUF429 domain-containing protein, partial [Acetobacteraceae bacterium]|nr:DUF429 domain-containing protein [Acetobacteraceae bacterium]